MSLTFINAKEAFEYYYELINYSGDEYNGTKVLFNVGFNILEPMNNSIDTTWRKWKKDYAEYEFNWYLSANRSVEDIKKKAKIWDKMHSGDNIVNSNYGYQWKRNNQLQYVVDELRRDNNSRRAVISIYDGKEHEQYKFDTPCTLAITFNIFNNKLNMSVMMRSNDLWYGFCNDQYCFSKLQKLIADMLHIEVGNYYHFSNNLHLYEKDYNKNSIYL